MNIELIINYCFMSSARAQWDANVCAKRFPFEMRVALAAAISFFFLLWYSSR